MILNAKNFPVQVHFGDGGIYMVPIRDSLGRVFIL